MEFKVKYVFRCFVLLLALFGIAHSMDYGLCPDFSCTMTLGNVNDPDNLFSKVFSDDWLLLSLLTVLLALFGIALLFIIAKGLNNRELEIYVKSEFMHAVASVMIILFSVWMVGEVSKGINYSPSGAMGINLVAGNKYSPSCAAAANIGYGLCKLNYYFIEIQKEVMRDERTLSECFSFYVFQFCPGLMDMLSFSNHYYHINSRVSRGHMLAEIILNLQVSLSVQKEILLTIHNSALSLFLPFGILLRVLPFTRGIGGLLIAIAIGFFFVFPVAYLIALEIPASEQVGQGLLPAQLCYPSMSGAIQMIQDDLSVVSSTFSIIESATDFIGRLRLIEWILPFVALSITVIFIRYSAPILGSDSGELLSVVSKLV